MLLDMCYVSLLSPKPVRHIFPVPPVGSGKTGKKVSLQLNQGSNKQALLQLLPAAESLETGNPVLYLQCALVTWQKSFHGHSPFFRTVRKRWSSPVGDFQLAGIGKFLIMPLMVFEQIAVVHLSARMKLGEMRKETVWYGCLKYKEAGLGDLRQTSPIFLTKQIMRSITKLLEGYIPS